MSKSRPDPDNKPSDDQRSEPSPSGPSRFVPEHTRLAESRPRKKALAGSKYSDTEIEQGLVAMALFSGNRRRASAALQRQGLEIPETTLREWRDRLYTDWYAQVQVKVMPRIRELAAEKHTELADLEGEAARKLLTRLMAEYDQIPPHALPGSIKSLDIGAAVNRDKAAMLRGENPDGQVGLRKPSDILSALQAKAPHLFENGRLTVEWSSPEPKPDAIEGSATDEDDSPESPSPQSI